MHLQTASVKYMWWLDGLESSHLMEWVVSIAEWVPVVKGSLWLVETDKRLPVEFWRKSLFELCISVVGKRLIVLQFSSKVLQCICRWGRK